MVDFRLTSQKVVANTPDEIRRTQALEKAKSAVYNKLGTAAETVDRLNLSPKAKLMQSLKAAYDKLPENDVKIAAGENNASATVPENSSGDIVDGILRGTLFDIV